MSTILKALQKAEEGRAKETLPGRIVSPDAPLDEGSPRRSYLIAAVAIAFFIASACYFMARHSGIEAARPESTQGRGSAVADQKGPVQSEALPALHLSGVLWDPARPVAIINGKALTTGSEIDGAAVTAIELSGVTVRWRGKSFQLSVR